jgi:hypothetical protein
MHYRSLHHSANVNNVPGKVQVRENNVPPLKRVYAFDISENVNAFKVIMWYLALQIEYPYFMPFSEQILVDVVSDILSTTIVDRRV